MVARFKVRKDGDDPGVFGVWDAAANGWRGRSLTEAQAHKAAADLELQYDAHGPRPAETVRRLEAPRRVLRAVWQSEGVLEAWVRHQDHWYGRVRGQSGHISWIPAAELRSSTAPTAPTKSADPGVVG